MTRSSRLARRRYIVGMGLGIMCMGGARRAAYARMLRFFCRARLAHRARSINNNGILRLENEKRPRKPARGIGRGAQ